MIDIGTQAIAGIGRSTSDTGKMISRASRKRPMTSPSGTAMTAASMKPNKMRRQLSSTCITNCESCMARVEAFEHRGGRGHVDETHMCMSTRYFVSRCQLSRNNASEMRADQHATAICARCSSKPALAIGRRLTTGGRLRLRSR